MKWLVSIGIVCMALVLMGGIDQQTKDALKVKHILRTIQRQPARSGGGDASAQVTERELNAYIDYRLKHEPTPLVDSIKIGLLDNNHVNGTISFDAKRLNLGVLLGENLDFDFKGIFHTRKGAARLDLISLQLGGQPVNPQVLDFVLGTAALINGTEVGGTDDWYELPKGIKRVMVSKAKAVIYY